MYKSNKGLTLKCAFVTLFSSMLIGFASCDKNSSFEEEKPNNSMELMFVESKSLPETSIDSVKSFTSKFGSYVKANPASTKSEYYNPTVDNISYACSVFGYKLTVNTGVSILVDDEWDGEYYMSF
jgi:hypothetical protein